MRLRERIETALTRRSPLAWFIWLAAPALCLVIPGPGVLLAAIWVLVFLWLGRLPASIVGIRQPGSWPRLIVLAPGLAAVVWVLDEFGIAPLTASLVGSERDLGHFQDLESNWTQLLAWLALGWLVGGFLEELVFRGFLIQIGVHLLGERFLWPIAIVGSTVFGLSHLYQGIAGVISTGTVGLLFAIVFVASRRNLVLTMLVHGFVNTISLGLAFLGIRALA